MNDQLPADVVFREACLRSKLVSEKQWEAAVSHARKWLKDEQPDKAITPKRLSNTIAKRLIEEEIITTYQAQQLRAGRTKLTLGPYLVTEFLGQGGMGQVFGAVHEIMGRHCAIKVLPLEKADDLTRESFAREIRMQAALDSPYLVRAFDAGREGNVHFLVTEYVPGTDLRRLVKDNGKLSVQQSASIIAQAAAGLAYAHDSGMIHRDIKPANILVTPDGNAKVADVGLAAFAMRPEDDPRAGKIVGTADYLSPEQIRTPTEVGPQSDLYSLGCTLYYACTGKVPFPGGDSKSKCKRHLTKAPWDPRKFSPDLPAEFVEIIADMLEKDLNLRIPNATEVVRRLTPFAANHDEASWLAELGLTAEDDQVDPAATSSAAGMTIAKPSLPATGFSQSASKRSWKSASEQGSDSALGGLTDELSHDSIPASQEDDSANTLSTVPPLPGLRPAETSADSHLETDPDPASVALPPPIASNVRVVSHGKFIAWTLASLIIGMAVGILLAATLLELP